MNVKNSENPEFVGPCSSGVTTNLGSAGVPAPIRRRRFSSAKIQPTRVKRVMQSDDEIGRMVASVPVAIGRAMEHFAEKLLESAAQCVQYSTSRTLSPSHMKQAVMQNPHFMFLEPLMREIPLPSLAGGELQWRTDWTEQPSFSGFHMPGQVMEPSCQMVVPMPHSQISLPKLQTTGGGTLPGNRRRQSNGETDGNETKPKRGRPRKVKKEDKCVDDDGLFVDEKLKVQNTSANGSTALTDRELMPPPTMLPIRAIAAVTSLSMIGKRSNQPFSGSHPTSATVNNINNGACRQRLPEPSPSSSPSTNMQSSAPSSSSSLPSTTSMKPLQTASDPEDAAIAATNLEASQ